MAMGRGPVDSLRCSGPKTLHIGRRTRCCHSKPNLGDVQSRVAGVAQTGPLGLAPVDLELSPHPRVPLVSAPNLQVGVMAHPDVAQGDPASHPHRLSLGLDLPREVPVLRQDLCLPLTLGVLDDAVLDGEPYLL